MQVEKTNDLVQKENAENGDQAVKKGDGWIAHWNAGKLGNDEGDDEFIRLHFPDLTFAHKPHNTKKRGENNGCSNKYKSHAFSF